MIETQSISYKINPNLKNKTVKLACFDLDHTLIKPKDGRTFPKTPSDFVLWHDNLVKEKIQSLHEQGYKLVIFSNQSDVVKPG
jgi:bifunctional polynucleotide phosphatase/kinase